MFWEKSASSLVAAQPLEKRFWENVYKTANCWFWIGTIAQTGYGQLSIGNKSRHAHHLAWFVYYGVWPEQWVLHTCDTPQCVRQDHLFLGTAADNTRDGISKGMIGRSIRTECRCGRPYDRPISRIVKGELRFSQVCRHCRNARRNALELERKINASVDLVAIQRRTANAE